MPSEHLDYEAEYDALRARLYPFAEHILAQLEEARVLAERQRANRGVTESLSNLDSFQADVGPLPPTMWSDRLAAPIEQRRLLRPWLGLALFGFLMFLLGFAARCLV